MIFESNYMKTIKVITLFLAAALLLACFSSCRKFDGSDGGAVIAIGANDAAAVAGMLGLGGGASSAPQQSSQSSAPKHETPAAQTPQTPAQAQDTPAEKPADTPSDKPAETPSQSAQDTPAQETLAETPAQNDGRPSSKEEIVAYYKTAFDLVKSSAKGVTHTVSDASNNPPVVEAGKLSSIAGTLMNTFLKTSEPNETMAASELPPKGVMKSALDPSFVGAAECNDAGDFYEIYIRLDCTETDPDVNPPAGGGKAGTLVDVIESSQVEEAAGSMIKFTNLKNSYFETSVKAKIEKSTGHLVEAVFTCPSYMSFDKVTAAILSVENARLGLTYTETFTVQW